MRILSICLDSVELVRFPLQRPSLLVGRSPSCDVVLRAPKVRPVHFLIEWVGAGAFDSNAGSWSIFDVSHEAEKDEKQMAGQAFGTGVMLGDEAAEIGPFSFKWSQDALIETDLEGKILSQSLELGENKLARRPSGSGKSEVLELVTVRRDSESVVEVEHFALDGAKSLSGRMKESPEIQVEYLKGPSQPDVQIEVSGKSEYSVFNRGQLQPSSQPKSKIGLRREDILQVRWKREDLFFRIVPKIDVPPVKLEILKDRYFLAFAGAVAATVLLLAIVLLGDFVPEEEIKPPPRIAQISIKEVLARPVEQKVAVEKTEDARTVKTKERKSKSLTKTKKKTSPLLTTSKAKPKKISAARYKKKSRKTKTGLNSPAKKKDVNTIGILGALKSGSRSKSAKKVRADMVINDAIVKDTVGGKRSRIKVKQPPVGAVGGASKRSGGKKAGLSAAATTLSVKDSYDARSIGPIAGNRGDVEFRIDYGQGGMPEIDGVKYGESVEGGLDKESVRRAIAAYRRDFRTCYERALLSKSRIRGRVVFKWRIDPKGPVSWIKRIKSTLKSEKLAGCVQNVLKGIRFPKAPNGKPTLVIYPFVFQSKSKK